jgi:hypothetical protein
LGIGAQGFFKSLFSLLKSFGYCRVFSLMALFAFFLLFFEFFKFLTELLGKQWLCLCLPIFDTGVFLTDLLLEVLGKLFLSLLLVVGTRLYGLFPKIIAGLNRAETVINSIHLLS